MIKKLLFLVLATSIYLPLVSQTIVSNKNDCIQNFTFEAKTVNGTNPRVDDIIISWDFSKTLNKENLLLVIEVQPLNSCWNGLDGTNRSPLKNYKITNLFQKNTGILKLEYSDLNCKCIKWKAKITNSITNCEAKTNWQFISFL
ncbi:MAG: hypothetical protein R2812_04715 [Gelidibacter sp.]